MTRETLTLGNIEQPRAPNTTRKGDAPARFSNGVVPSQQARRTAVQREADGQRLTGGASLGCAACAPEDLQYVLRKRIADGKKQGFGTDAGRLGTREVWR